MNSMSQRSQDFAPDALEGCLRFAFPPVLVRLAEALLEPGPDAAVIGGCLALDPVLAGCALRLASDLTGLLAPDPYGGGCFARTAALAGVQPLLDLVLSYPLRLHLCRETPPDPYRHFASWRATLQAALAAEELALRLAPDLSGEAYGAVLLRSLAQFMGQGMGRGPDSKPDSAPDQEAFTRAAHTLAAGLGLPQKSRAAMLAGPELLRMKKDAPLLSRLVAAALCWAESAPAESSGNAGSVFLPELYETLHVSLGLNTSETDALFSRCALRLDTLLHRLGLEGGYAAAHSCLETLHSFQALSQLAARLRPEQGGPSALAARLGEQLRGYWGLKHWELALRLPGTSSALFFRVRSEEGPEKRSDEKPERGLPKAISEELGPLPWSKLPWSPAFIRYTLSAESAGGTPQGQLRLPPTPYPSGPPLSSLPAGKAASLALYLRFVSLILEERQGWSGSTLRRAESFSSLPLAVARCDAQGGFLDANEPFLALFSLPAPPTHTTVFPLFEQRFSFDLERVRREALNAPSRMARQHMVCLPPGIPGETPSETLEDALDLRFHSIRDGREFLLLLAPAGSGNESGPGEAALREWELFSQIFRVMPELVCTLDNAGRVVWVAGQRQELVDRDFFSLAQPASSFFQGVWEAAFLTGLTTTRLVELSFANRGSDESTDAGLSLYECSFTPLNSRSGHAFLVVARDLNTPRRLDERVRHQVTQDGLTGLFNHSQGQALLDAAEEKARRKGGFLGIIAFDIHNFHLCNLMYGYATSDVILRRVAAGINASLRKGDVAFRYSGDEFVVLAPDIRAEELEQLARAICRSVRHRCDAAVELGCGLALCGPTSPPFRHLLAAARAALLGRTPDEPVWAH